MISRCPLFHSKQHPGRLNTVRLLVMNWERPFRIFKTNSNSRIPKRRPMLNSSLRIITWNRPLAEMKVDLRSHKLPVSEGRRREMRQWMIAVHSLRTFELVISWDDKRDCGFVVNAPFMAKTPGSVVDPTLFPRLVYVMTLVY